VPACARAHPAAARPPARPQARLALLAALLLLACARAAAPPTDDGALAVDLGEPWPEIDNDTAGEAPTDDNAADAAAEARAEAQFERALAIRGDAGATEAELRHAVALLYAAAGLEHLSVRPRAAEKDAADGASPPPVTAADVTIRWRAAAGGGPARRAATRELALAFADGDGAPRSPAIAHALLRALAAAGDPEAQGDVGLLLALGVEPAAPASPSSSPAAAAAEFLFVEPDLPAALAHYFFAARGGDPVAAMALGYRHLHGLGVPRSCRAALLHYEAAAVAALKAAGAAPGLPLARPLRLSHRALAQRPTPSAEQELLHYQWFADHGHAEAARAAARLLARGAGGRAGGADAAAAVRYLEAAAAAGDADAMAHLGHMAAAGALGGGGGGGAAGHAAGAGAAAAAAERAAAPAGAVADEAAAWRWFWRAAEKGHPSGFFGMGVMHLTGAGAEVDLAKALQYFRQAAEGGRAWAGQGDAVFFVGESWRGCGLWLWLWLCFGGFVVGSVRVNLEIWARAGPLGRGGGGRAGARRVRARAGGSIGPETRSAAAGARESFPDAGTWRPGKCCFAHIALCMPLCPSG
jgi:TPR repeat protein